jgi:hypothetical protein
MKGVKIYIFFITMVVMLVPMCGSTVFSAGVTGKAQLQNKKITSSDINAAKSTYGLKLDDAIWVTSIANKYKVTVQAVVVLQDAGKDKNAISQLLELYAKGRSILAGSVSNNQRNITQRNETQHNATQRDVTAQLCRIFGYSEEKADKWIKMAQTIRTYYIYYT